eukprot:10254674-Alexandrium_andersonii.AAC.1
MGRLSFWPSRTAISCCSSSPPDRSPKLSCTLSSRNASAKKYALHVRSGAVVSAGSMNMRLRSKSLATGLTTMGFLNRKMSVPWNPPRCTWRMADRGKASFQADARASTS